MKTQCPQCNTHFRLTENQVNAANGFVRCGVCNEVFNALEIEQENQVPGSADTSSNLQDEPRDLDVQDHPVDEEIFQPEKFFPGSNFAESVYDTSEQTEDQNGGLVDGFAANLADGQTGENDTTKPEETTEPLKAHEAEITTDDFFNEEVTETLPHVVPEKLKDHYQQTPFYVTALWGLGTVVLTLTLVAEYIWFNRNDFSEAPEIQSLVIQGCEIIGCPEFAMRDASRIKLISRNVYTHPNEKQALMVNVTIKNSADFAQPFPVMQIDFSDIRGTIVAARRFYPSEYLQVSQQELDAQNQLIPPYTSYDISMEIQDPGSQAMTYEFNFL